MKTNASYLNLALLIVTLWTQSLRAMDLSVSVSANKSNMGYNTSLTQSVSASIAMYLTDFIRIGFTHSQETNDDKGFSVSADTDEAQITSDDLYQNRTTMVANSADLALILFNGEIFAPYIFAGAVIKDYKFRMEKGGEVSNGSARVGPVPNGGLGLGIRLNKDFSLKLTYSVSPGIKKLPGLPAESVLDTSTAVGITYHL